MKDLCLCHHCDVLLTKATRSPRFLTPHCVECADRDHPVCRLCGKGFLSHMALTRHFAEAHQQTWGTATETDGKGSLGSA